MRSWRALLNGALHGFTQQAILRTYARNVTLVPQVRLSATPVLGKRGIEFILVRIGPSPTDVAEPGYGYVVEEEEQRRRLSRARTPLSAAVSSGPTCPPGALALLAVHSALALYSLFSFFVRQYVYTH